MKTLTEPSSMWTGNVTVSARRGSRRTARRPGSRLRRSAARSNWLCATFHALIAGAACSVVMEWKPPARPIPPGTGDFVRPRGRPCCRLRDGRRPRREGLAGRGPSRRDGVHTTADHPAVLPRRLGPNGDAPHGRIGPEDGRNGTVTGPFPFRNVPGSGGGGPRAEPADAAAARLSGRGGRRPRGSRARCAVRPRDPRPRSWRGRGRRRRGARRGLPNGRRPRRRAACGGSRSVRRASR